MGLWVYGFLLIEISAQPVPEVLTFPGPLHHSDQVSVCNGTRGTTSALATLHSSQESLPNTLCWLAATDRMMNQNVSLPHAAVACACCAGAAYLYASSRTPAQSLTAQQPPAVSSLAGPALLSDRTMIVTGGSSGASFCIAMPVLTACVPRSPIHRGTTPIPIPIRTA